MNNEMTMEQALQMIEELKKQVAEKENKVKVDSSVPKNHRVGKPSDKKKYVLLSKTLDSFGKVPQQQKDIASLLSRGMEVGIEYTEAEVFNLLVDGSGDYTSLCTSKQDPTYLFRYYRGLKNDGKHAGFIARGFIQEK